MSTLRLVELSKCPEQITGGHRLCAGCGITPIIRQVLHAIEEPVVVCSATGCLEVASTIFPYTAWRIPWIHNAFENAAATISGVETMYRSLKKQGKLPQDQAINFVAIGGDGGTYDIGLQSLSGAIERGHRFLYICYDNEAYMNTGIQRSSSTPLGAATTTTPAGKVIPGKRQLPKDLTAIILAHHLPYAAQAVPSHWGDLMKKARKALAIDGPTFINVLAPCPRGWRTEEADTIELARLAVETCFWPLFEVENGAYKINVRPAKKVPITAWLKPQGRFAHLFKPEHADLLEEIQRFVDERWEKLIRLAEEKSSV